jgi:uncharacterized protein YkwD
LKTAIIILLFIFAIPVFANNSGNDSKLNTAANARYLSPIEKEVVLEINRFRSAPAKYANKYIAPLAKYYKNKLLNYPGDKTTIRTREGVKALHECVQELQTATPQPVLQPSKILTKSANDLQKHQARTGKTGHAGNNNSTLKERIERYGEWQVQIAENIAYGNTSARQIVVFLLIDDGVKNRGHRKNLLNPDLKIVGVSFGKHPVYKTMCVMDFAGGINNE